MEETPKKSPGAPKGNTNALKHGFYSRSFRAVEQTELNEFDPASLQNEIELMRVFILRTAELGEQAAHNFMHGARLTIDEPTVLTQVINLVDNLRLDQSDADNLIERAKGICPYVDATKNNVTLTLKAVLDTPVTA